MNIMTTSRKLGLGNLVAGAAALAFAASTLAGCNLIPGMGGSKDAHHEETIEAPKATRSPDMDFTKITAIGIFPLFPGGDEENDEFAESLVNSLTGEVQQRQGQWKITGYHDLLEVVNKNDLGTGYKNLQADFNTPAGPSNTSFMLSGGTKQFLTDLQKASSAQAFLIGSYVIGQKQVMEDQGGGMLSTAPAKQVPVMKRTCTVHVALFYVPDQKVWWNAVIERAGEPGDVVDSIAKSLGSNLGKGKLQQL